DTRRRVRPGRARISARSATAKAAAAPDAGVSCRGHETQHAEERQGYAPARWPLAQEHGYFSKLTAPKYGDQKPGKKERLQVALCRRCCGPNLLPPAQGCPLAHTCQVEERSSRR